MIWKLLGAIKIGWVIGTLLASSLCAAERPVPTRPIVPIPESAEQHDARSGGTHDAASKPPDTRPRVYVHTVHRKGDGPALCPPCEAFDDWWLENCETAPFNIIPVEYESFEALPPWVAEVGVPCVQYESESSSTGWRKREWYGLAELVKHWKQQNPKRVGELRGVKRA